jgi:hypothetical protein
MTTLSLRERQYMGMRAAESPMVRQDKIWARYSSDKVDVAHGLSDVIRALVGASNTCRPLRAISAGSSSEPQFRILESMFRGGLWLVDVEREAIDIIRERNRRQSIGHVHPIQGDYLSLFGNEGSATRFTRDVLSGQRADLIILHHSMYYAPRSAWTDLIWSLYSQVLNRADKADKEADETGGAIHAVLSSSRADDPKSANWFYNHFAGRYFGVRNTQDLPEFAGELRKDPRFSDALIQTRTSQCRFWCDDFGEFMHGVWMILLHPNVHRFDEVQQREVIEYVYENVYMTRHPLVQQQDHLYIQVVGHNAGKPKAPPVAACFEHTPAS